MGINVSPVQTDKKSNAFKLATVQGVVAGGIGGGLCYGTCAKYMDVLKAGNLYCESPALDSYAKRASSALVKAVKLTDQRAKNARVLKNAPQKLKHAKNLADRSARSLHLALKEFEKTGTVNNAAEKVIKGLNLKTALVFGAVTAGVSFIISLVMAKVSESKKAKEV